jgi:hypothetical protein
MSKICVFTGQVDRVVTEPASAAEPAVLRTKLRVTGGRVLGMHTDLVAVPEIAALFEEYRLVTFIGQESGANGVVPLAVVDRAIADPTLLRVAQAFSALRRGDVLKIREPQPGSFQLLERYWLDPHCRERIPGLMRMVHVTHPNGIETISDEHRPQWTIGDFAAFAVTWSDDVVDPVESLSFADPEPWLATLMALDQRQSIRRYPAVTSGLRKPYSLMLKADGSVSRIWAEENLTLGHEPAFKDLAFSDLLTQDLTPNPMSVDTIDRAITAMLGAKSRTLGTADA